MPGAEQAVSALVATTREVARGSEWAGRADKAKTAERAGHRRGLSANTTNSNIKVHHHANFRAHPETPWRV